MGWGDGCEATQHVYNDVSSTEMTFNWVACEMHLVVAQMQKFAVPPRSSRPGRP